MSLSFTRDDIFDIAVQIERKGNEFYSEAGARLAAGDLKACFARLSAMELEHARVFQELKETCSEKQKDDAGLGSLSAAGVQSAYSTAAASYLKACINGCVVEPAPGAESWNELRRPEDVVRRAIVAEKDSIALYTGIKAFIADDPCVTDKLDRVIAEEMNHIAQLSAWLEQHTAGHE